MLLDSFNGTTGTILLFILFSVPLYIISYPSKGIRFLLKSSLLAPVTIIYELISSEIPPLEGKWFKRLIILYINDITINIVYLGYGTA